MEVGSCEPSYLTLFLLQKGLAPGNFSGKSHPSFWKPTSLFPSLHHDYIQVSD